MDMEDEDDIHMCLTCSKTISGLVNYIQHKKNECSGKKTPKKVASSTFLPTATSTGQGHRSPSSTQSFDNDTFFMENSYHNATQAGMSTGTMLSEQSTFLHTDTLSSSHANYHPSNYQDGADFSKIPLLTTAQSSPTESELQIGLPTYTNNPTSTYTNNPTSTYTNNPTSTYTNNPTSTYTNNPTSTYTNNPTSDTTQLTYSLNSVFSTSQNNSVGKSSIDAITSLSNSLAMSEDHGIMSAIIKGVSNKQKRSKVLLPTTFETHFDENETFTTKKEDSAGKEEVIDDFFQSLELMSKSDPRADKGSTFNQLPISNILNSLTFSSDEEDLSFSFAEDVSFDSLTEDSSEEMAPPRHHTGGKWKPGEKPTAYRKNRWVYVQFKQ